MRRLITDRDELRQLDEALLEGAERYLKFEVIPMNQTIWAETTTPSEAAEKLLSFIHQIRALDAAYERMMKDKATAYREAKRAGFVKAAVKAIVNNAAVDDDVQALRKYLELTVNDEAASAMRDGSHFGVILFGDADSWPADYVDPKHGDE
jgi:uncharacterized protein (UPF0335 family)